MPPSRILFLHPDAYGDLFLFEPVPRLVRHAWPQAEVAVLIRQPYEDAIPLLASDGVRWLTTACNPYREGPGANPAALAALRDAVGAFQPDCVVAACAAQTWLESAVAAFLPGTRQISLGHGLTDPLARAALEEVLPVDWLAIYPEKVPVERDSSEWEKNLALASAVLGHAAPRWWPVARVPEPARERAGQILAGLDLPPGEFVVCAAAGGANVPIKDWPAAAYGETLAWLERAQGIRALLVGHAAEREHLESVQRAARAHGAEPALWLGQDGEMPVVAGLLAAARFYFGNDTGALHLAASLGRPVVSVFGGGTWPRFVPVAHRALSIVQPLPCFGCDWDCHFVDAPCVRTISPAAVRRALEQFLKDEAEGRTIFEADGLEPGARALIDAATPRLRFLREDSADRMHQIQRLTVQTRALDAQLQTDHTGHQRAVEKLTALLRASEADRDTRLGQVGKLTALLQTSETDRDTRAKQVEELTALLQTSETDRDTRLGQVEELTALLQTSETDRDTRAKQVEELTTLLQTSETDRGAREDQVEELTALLQTSETDRAARENQVEELTALLQTSETDRAARATQIEELTTLLQENETDRAARARQIEELTVLLQTSEADRAARASQIEELTALLQTSETDRAARGSQIEQLTTWLKTSEAERATLGKQVAELASQNEALSADARTPRESSDRLTTDLASLSTP